MTNHIIFLITTTLLFGCATEPIYLPPVTAETPVSEISILERGSKIISIDDYDISTLNKYSLTRPVALSPGQYKINFSLNFSRTEYVNVGEQTSKGTVVRAGNIQVRDQTDVWCSVKLEAGKIYSEDEWYSLFSDAWYRVYRLNKTKIR